MTCFQCSLTLMCISQSSLNVNAYLTLSHIQNSTMTFMKIDDESLPPTVQK